MWSRSLVPGGDSSSDSLAVVRLVEPLFSALGVSDLDTMQFVVRKLAHFCEYLVMGLVAARAVPDAWGSGRSRAATAALAAVVVAVPVCDECIQLMVPGRSGMVRDVLIDVAGAVTGLAITAAVRRLRSRPGRR